MSFFSKIKDIKNKVVKFWIGLNKFFKVISVTLGTILSILTISAAIIKFILPDPSSKIITQLGNLDQYEVSEKNRIFDSCAHYNKKGLKCILDVYETMECLNNPTKDAVLDWFNEPGNKFCKRRYVGYIIRKGNSFFFNYIYDLKIHQKKKRGMLNYIELFHCIEKSNEKRVHRKLNRWKKTLISEVNKENIPDDVAVDFYNLIGNCK